MIIKSTYKRYSVNACISTNMTITSVLNLYFTSEEIRGIIMIKNVLLRIFVSLPLLFAAVNAQDGVDAIEKARQAKEAADKAAAEAAAATEAAIEAAAAKAAKAAREEAKKKKEEEEARKIAEAKAAEEAELDAAASAAAEEAKRKMAAELGLEYEEEILWMGHRPSTPDSLPLIGPVDGNPDIVCAFGGQHIGLTIGPKIGTLVTDLISENRTNFDFSPFQPNRFN